MSLLTIIQDAADEVGVLQPSSVINNNDQGVKQLLRLSNRMGWTLMKAFDWQVLTKEDTFTSTATEEQSGILNSDFDRFLRETMWDRTDIIFISGPITAVEWQGLKAQDYAETQFPKFRYRGGSVYIIPTLDAGNTIAYEYVSKNWCQSSGGTGQTEWADDTDTGVLDEELMTRALVWAYKNAEGLPAEEAAFSYESYFRMLCEQDQPDANIMVAGDIFATTGRRFLGAPPSLGTNSIL